ncbi:MAG: hypothetical protein INQ03_13320 [Candidatus Heimdallarchaeota archaeon]|nr:hypothetical protein [Candidatus Heimdallarchaeota archaeon]
MHRYIYFPILLLLLASFLSSALVLDELKVEITILNTLDDGGGAKDIEIRGNTAYVLSDSGLDIYNVSDPKTAEIMGHYYTDGYLGHSIAVYNNYVFTAADDQGLKIIDVHDPTTPILQTTITSTRPAAVYIIRNYLLVSNWEHDLEIYDLGNMPSIDEISRIQGKGFSYVTASEDLVFAFANNGTMIVISIDDESNFGLIMDIVTDELLSCMATSNNVWYIGGSKAFYVYDANNLNEVTLENSYSDTESFFTNMLIQDDFLYVSDFGIGFRIYELSDPLKPIEIAQNSVGGAPLGFTVVGDLAYVASQAEGIKIIKLSFSELESSNSNDTVTSNELLITLIFVSLSRKKTRKH